MGKFSTNVTREQSKDPKLVQNREISKDQKLQVDTQITELSIDKVTPQVSPTKKKRPSPNPGSLWQKMVSTSNAKEKKTQVPRLNIDEYDITNEHSRKNNFSRSCTGESSVLNSERFLNLNDEF